MNGQDKLFSISLKKDSDYAQIVDRNLSDEYLSKGRKKILAQMKNAYQKAPRFNEVFPFIEECILYDEENLFKYVKYTLQKTIDYLDLKTELIVSSHIQMDHSLKSAERVLEILVKCNASEYFNTSAGLGLYDKEKFKQNNIELHYVNPILKEYKQMNNDFISGLSIIDVLMFNTKEEIQNLLQFYELLE